MTNTNYWMVNTIDNCLHYANAIQNEIESEKNFMTRDRSADIQYWKDVIALLNKKRSQHIIEEHDPEIQPVFEW